RVCRCASSRSEFDIDLSDGNSGWRISSPSICVPVSTISGKTSAGCSYAYAASEHSASTSPTASSHLPIEPPYSARHFSTEKENCVNHKSKGAKIAKNGFNREFNHSTIRLSLRIAADGATLVVCRPARNSCSFSELQCSFSIRSSSND